MATVFWDSLDIAYIGYLKKRKTDTGLCYAEWLGRIHVELKKKKKNHLVKIKMPFHHHNAPARTTTVATAKLVELGYELLPYPPYS